MIKDSHIRNMIALDQITTFSCLLISTFFMVFPTINGQGAKVVEPFNSYLYSQKAEMGFTSDIYMHTFLTRSKARWYNIFITWQLIFMFIYIHLNHENQVKTQIKYQFFWPRRTYSCNKIIILKAQEEYPQKMKKNNCC